MSNPNTCITNQFFSVTHKATDSPIWYDLLKVKDVYLQGRGIAIKNGERTRFWVDPWLYDKPIMFIAPILYILCDQKDVNVADVKMVIFKSHLEDG